MNFIKLLTFEMNRFMKLYIGLILLTVISQLVGLIIVARGYVSSATQTIVGGGISEATYIQQHGPMEILRFVRTLWFYGPIAISVAGLMFYVFLIWYRDWFGKNTFIYRLLMLPTSRLNIFLSKATAIMLMVLGIVSVQLVLFQVENTLFKSLVPKALRIDLTIREMVKSDWFLSLIVPESFTHFIINYGMGFLFVIAMFTVIMLERSFRIKGILLGVLYLTGVVLFIAAPFIIQFNIGKFYLYPMEMLILEVILVSIVIAGSIWLSGYLLKNKITV